MDLSPFQGENALKLITTAVTPAVMISATAILIGGVSSKHQSMSDRLRMLTSEYRLAETSESRRANIRRQIASFQKRLCYTLIAHIVLFCATGLFIGTVILTSLMKINLVYGSFLLGVALLLIAVICEILELRLARSTMSLEIAGTLDGAK